MKDILTVDNDIDSIFSKIIKEWIKNMKEEFETEKRELSNGMKAQFRQESNILI